MKKSWKDLVFINPENKGNNKSEQKVTESAKGDTTFPTQNSPTHNTFSTEQAPPQNVPLECAPHMEAIMKLYEDGFTQLNQPGVDFFEYFQAVVEGGVTNPQAFTMALKMLKGMEKSMTKDTLLTQSAFYVNELTKVYNNYNSEGINKKNELITAKNNETQKLKSDIQLLREQLSTKETQLSQIDGKYQPSIQEIDCKIMANDNAKNRIMSSISAVINGIKQNL